MSFKQFLKQQKNKDQLSLGPATTGQALSKPDSPHEIIAQIDTFLSDIPTRISWRRSDFRSDPRSFVSLPSPLRYTAVSSEETNDQPGTEYPWGIRRRSRSFEPSSWWTSFDQNGTNIQWVPDPDTRHGTCSRPLVEMFCQPFRSWPHTTLTGRTHSWPFSSRIAPSGLSSGPCSEE